MRLVKGFFLRFLAAEWLLNCCRAPTGGNHPEFTEPVGDMNSSSSSISTITDTSMILGFWIAAVRKPAVNQPANRPEFTEPVGDMNSSASSSSSSTSIITGTSIIT